MSSKSAEDRRAAASWFPGHMAAGLRAMLETADLIDLVLEVRDARVPAATAVAALHTRLKSKRTFVLLNRQDLAEPAATRAWLGKLAEIGVPAYAVTGTAAATLRSVRSAILEHKGRRAKTRVAVVGAPNTGKSSVINALVHRKRALAQNKAGVTRHIRWIALDDRVDVLDTPGVLEPRITNKTTAWQLALCGMLPESAFDVEEVVGQYAAWLAGRAWKTSDVSLETFARQRGMLRRGGELDRLNAARTFIKEFRAGRLGRITFELLGETS